MVALKAGCLLERLPPLSAKKALRFFEYAPRAPLPTFATLARFRKQWGPQVQVAFVCPKSTWTTPKGPFRESPELEAGLAWAIRVADILDAFAFVVAPGAELSPGARDRQLLKTFVERLKSTGRQVVIAPRGLWEAESAAEFAAELGCLYGFDPMEDDAPKGALAYGRVRPMGARPRLTDGHLLQILERSIAGGCDDLIVSIESEDAYRATKRLNTLAEELANQPDEEEEEEEELDEASDDEDEESVDEDEDAASEEVGADESGAADDEADDDDDEDEANEDEADEGDDEADEDEADEDDDDEADEDDEDDGESPR